MEIITPSIPRRLQISQTMMEDFIHDPVMGAKVILGYNLDVFQRVRLKLYWWSPYLIDSSGISSGKTIVDWVYLVLRCVLIPDHVSLFYNQTFQAMKDNFWPLFAKCNNPIYQAQVGQFTMDGEENRRDARDTAKEPSCYKVFFKNKSIIMCPAPGFLQKSKGQAGRRTNDLLVDEWTKAEAMAKDGSGIDDQLIARATRECFNQNHPFWCNHITFTASAEDSIHPAYRRIRSFKREIKLGNPNSVLCSWSYKDWSDFEFSKSVTFKDKFRPESQIRFKKQQSLAQQFKKEVLGIWSEQGRGWYTPEMIGNGEELGRQRKTKVALSRHDDQKVNNAPKNALYFLGVDPAPAQDSTNDDGAVMVARAIKMVRPGEEQTKRDDDDAYWLEQCQPSEFQFDLVYAKRVRGYSMRQWSGLVHNLHQRFNFSNICVDAGPGGGGGFLKVELSRRAQLIENAERDCNPILTVSDSSSLMGQYILTMFSPKDKDVADLWPDASRGHDLLVDISHTDLANALQHSMIGFLSDEYDPNEARGWSEEKQWAFKILTGGRTDRSICEQLKLVTVRTKEDGQTLALSRSNARLFTTYGKKDDFVSALIMCWISFLVWLKRGQSFGEDDDDDSAMCGC